MKSIICAFNAELEYAKKMLSYIHPLASLGAQLSKLKSINKQPPSLAADIFYTISQAVMPKSSAEAISIVVVLLIAGLLESIGAKDNKIISEIYNGIISPSNLCYVVKKYREATFMMIAGFVCNYPFIITCDKG